MYIHSGGWRRRSAAIRNKNLIAGATLDVLEGEEAIESGQSHCGQERDLALMLHPKVLMTPHLAFDTVEALHRIRHTTAEIMSAFSRGDAHHVVAQ